MNKIIRALEEHHKKREQKRLIQLEKINRLDSVEVENIYNTYQYLKYIIKDIEHDRFISFYLKQKLKTFKIEQIKYKFQVKAELFGEVWNIYENVDGVKSFVRYINKHHNFRNDLVHDYLLDAHLKEKELKKREEDFKGCISEKEKKEYDKIWRILFFQNNIKCFSKCSADIIESATNKYSSVKI